jgi:uncharacterized protein (TIGR02145 family)
MQEMTPAICDSMDLYSSLKLRDDRGTTSQYYRVRKMPDNRCWMIDNLKLELYTGMQLKPVDTDVQANTTVTLATGGLTGNFTTSGYLTVDNTSSIGTQYVNYNAWRQANPSEPVLPGTEFCVARNFIDPVSTTGCGYLYNWYTTTASAGTYDKNSGYVERSICPKGWRLPRGGDGTLDQNEVAVLNSAMYDGSTLGSLSNDTNYVKNWWHTGMFAGSRSGIYRSGFSGEDAEFYEQGAGGFFWSSSAYASNSALYLRFNYNSMSAGVNSNYRATGVAVRCIASY